MNKALVVIAFIFGIVLLKDKLGGTQGSDGSGSSGGTVAKPARLIVSNSPVTRNTALKFTFRDFTAYSAVTVSVQGGGSLSIKADASGAGSGSFVIGESQGNYTLNAVDAKGKKATTPFVVQEKAAPAGGGYDANYEHLRFEDGTEGFYTEAEVYNLYYSGVVFTVIDDKVNGSQVVHVLFTDNTTAYVSVQQLAMLTQIGTSYTVIG